MHPSKRDSLLGTGSIGRSHGGLNRAGSHESLTAHPLLSPTLPGSSSSSVSSAASSTETATTAMPAPKYVPYTPRQRATPAAAATTGATMQPSIQASPPQPTAHGDATSKLQLMNLKAAAQKGGLDTASTGWAILEKLGTESDHSPEWNEVWNAISKGKATLLLPTEPHLANETITPEFIKDHIAFWDNASSDAPVVTLSGMRGTMADEVLTIRSSVDVSSKVFQAIQDPLTRNTALRSLPPLPLPANPIQSSLPTTPLSPPLPTSPKPPSPGPTYPTYALTSHHPSLPLPPRPHASTSTPTKPPLPPRPRPGLPVNAAQSRLSNPFASLFGRTATSTPPASPTTGPAAAALQASAAPATSDVHAQSPDGTEHVIGVPAFTLSRRINRRSVARDVLRAVQHEVRAGLVPAGAPSWVAERIEEFAEREGLLPFVKGKGSKRLEDGSSLGGYIVGGGVSRDEPMDDVGQRFQDFYSEVEEQLVKRKWRGRRSFGKGLVLQHLNGSVASSADSSTSGDEKESVRDEDETEKEDEAEEKPEDEAEKKIRAVVEAVERTICSVFYDRLFVQSFADDATHDEALSSRIAAVNLLDLTLGHLGVDVGSSDESVTAVVRACGETLTQLDLTCRAPADKAAILVASHKILVDGLSRLPPIKLKPEDDQEDLLDDKTPRAHNFGHRAAEDEEDDTQNNAESSADNVLHDSPTVVISPEAEVPENVPFRDDKGKEDRNSLTVNPRASSPRLTISPPPPSSPTPVSGDVILPLMIYAAVKANPPHLVSHLLFTQRFRNQSVGGEESYCLINLMAVAEFLENVDLAALGLGESESSVISTAELTPITVNRPGSSPTTPLAANATLRGRVEQQVDAIAGSANKVIFGVVDSSFGVLRALLPGTQAADAPAAGDAEGQEARPGFTILRRDTGFSIASFAASLPGAGIRAKTPVQKDEESGQQLVEVPSRPASIRSRVPSSSEEESDEEDDEEDDEDEEEEHDTRSIRSFESMMSSRSQRKRRKKLASMNGRKSITDRLASMPGLSRLSGSALHDSKTSPPPSRRSSLLVPPSAHQSLHRFDTPMSSRPTSPIAIRISPPNPRFLECSEDDIKVSEVGELLREYKRMVEAVRAMGGFHQD